MHFRFTNLSVRFISLPVREMETRSFKFKDLNVKLVSREKLKRKPDINTLQFGKHFTDHMLKIEYHKKEGGWQAPLICPFENLSLHPAAKVFHYAIELFEGLKAYRGRDKKIRIFRPDLNMARMNITATRARLPNFEPEELINCISRLISIDSEWVPHSDSASLYIRPTLIGIEPTLGISWSDSALLYVILSPVGSYFNSDNKISLLADPKFVRAWPGGVGDRKMGSNYAPTVHIQKNAAKKGFQQVLWLYGEDKQITEAGTMNFFLVYLNKKGEKEMVTPPLDGLILPGITRQSILELASEWNEWNVSERKITMDEVVKLSTENRLLEVFGAGTACVISPVDTIFYQGQTLKIPTLKQKNSIHSRLLKTLLDIQYGVIEHSWARFVE